MSRFYASIQGNRGVATRQGTKSSGIQSHARGWKIGARVDLWVDDDGKDNVKVVLTGGSNQPGTTKDLGTFKED